MVDECRVLRASLVVVGEGGCVWAVGSGRVLSKKEFHLQQEIKKIEIPEFVRFESDQENVTIWNRREFLIAHVKVTVFFCFK